MHYLHEMRIRFFISLFVFGFLNAQNVSSDYTVFVNPFVGTAGTGHTFPGALRPFGMVQLSPDTRTDGSWEGCSGYHYSDSLLYGFSHTHLSGTGVSDWGDVLLLPQSGKYSFDPEKYRQAFRHSDEKASPGYYAVTLKNNNIRVELTATERTGWHRIQFPAKEKKFILLDLVHRDKPQDASAKWISKKILVGKRFSEGWAQNQKIFFAIEFSEPVVETIWEKNGKEIKNTVGESAEKLRACFRFEPNPSKPLIIKVGISLVSEEGALLNLKTETQNESFDSVLKKARDAWNNELSKIRISDSRDSLKTVFYTALYHCMIHPSLASDVNGFYRGMDDKIYKAQGFKYYQVFSLWDTHRALHPLLNLIDKPRSLDFVKTMLEMYKQTGALPVWELSARETDCMIGNHALGFLADAWSSGIRNFDPALALEAMVSSHARRNYKGIAHYRDFGFLQVQDESESVSKTLEYAYNDWCIYMLASQTGKSELAGEYLIRCMAWKNLLDTKTGFFRPRFNGNWLSPFDPYQVNNHFTEANAWHYAFSVPHDIYGLMKFHDGANRFEKKLDSLFSVTSKTSGREQPDITGLIGQYAHGNEPSHLYAYLYNYLGKPEKSITLVQKIITEFYSGHPDGLPGNEDCGQMSAWYVFSALGFYPASPGSGIFLTGAPLFNRAVVQTSGGKEFVIRRDAESVNSCFLNQIFFDGEERNRLFLSAFDLSSSAEIIFYLTDKPQEQKRPFVKPPSLMPTHPPEYFPAPLIFAPFRSFSDSMQIKVLPLTSPVKGQNIQLSGDDGKVYGSQAWIRTPGSYLAFYEKGRPDGFPGTKPFPTTQARFYKYPGRFSISVEGNPNPQYACNGPQSLADGIIGDTDWRKGDWMGYQGQEVAVMIDLGKETTLSEISLGFLQDTRSWILFPPMVKYFGMEEDGNTWIFIGSVTAPESPENMEVKRQDFQVKFPGKKLRKIRIEVSYPGPLPDWHPGRGMPSFIFTDEIGIK